MRILSIDIGVRNLACCDVEWSGKSSDVPTIHAWDLHNLCPRAKDVKNVRTEKLVSALIPLFRPIAENEGESRRAQPKNISTGKVDTDQSDWCYQAVVIERQKSGASKMVSLSHAIQTVFEIFSPSTKILFFSAKHKLGVFPDWVDPETGQPTSASAPGISARDKTYADSHYRNKRIAVETCGQILAAHTAFDRWRPMWDENKKKRDDLADSFLQALAFIRQTKEGGGTREGGKRSAAKKQKQPAPKAKKNKNQTASQMAKSKSKSKSKSKTAPKAKECFDRKYEDENEIIDID